jgi:putative copper resistance protein D
MARRLGATGTDDAEVIQFPEREASTLPSRRSMQAEPLITWPDPIREYVGFAAQFVALGAVGFRFAAVRDRVATDRDSTARIVYDDALRRGATIGLVGIVVQAALFFMGLPKAAARAHVTVAHLVIADLPTTAAVVLFLAAIVGLAMAATGRRLGWPLALIGAVIAPLTGLLAGQWSRLVNPIHRVAAGLWIGTLFILLVAGLSAVLRDTRTREQRGRIVADMVNGFSPLALTCGGVVVASGLTTAWTHLNPLASLWTTPYGYTLIVKLLLVAFVFGLGAWNWRRARPALGSEDAAHMVRRSATAEITVAALVLAATAILVSLPSPKPPAKPIATSSVPADSRSIPSRDPRLPTPDRRAR